MSPDNLKSGDNDDLEALLNEHGIPNGKIYRAPEMMEDPQFQVRESIVRVDCRSARCAVERACLRSRSRCSRVSWSMVIAARKVAGSDRWGR